MGLLAQSLCLLFSFTNIPPRYIKIPTRIFIQKKNHGARFFIVDNKFLCTISLYLTKTLHIYTDFCFFIIICVAAHYLRFKRALAWFLYKNIVYEFNI